MPFALRDPQQGENGQQRQGKRPGGNGDQVHGCAVGAFLLASPIDCLILLHQRRNLGVAQHQPVPVKVNASFKLTGWNTNQLKLRVANILTEYGEVMDKRLKEQIQASQYTWPGETKRKNGQIVGSPRNIVDTGRFLASQRRERPSATTLLFTWNTPYAATILTGYTTKNGTLIPGTDRNWIKPALEAEPLDKFFARLWRQYAGKGL